MVIKVKAVIQPTLMGKRKIGTTEMTILMMKSLNKDSNNSTMKT